MHMYANMPRRALSIERVGNSALVGLWGSSRSGGRSKPLLGDQGRDVLNREWRGTLAAGCAGTIGPVIPYNHQEGPMEYSRSLDLL
jgi:hypothetical protein